MVIDLPIYKDELSASYLSRLATLLGTTDYRFFNSRYSAGERGHTMGATLNLNTEVIKSFGVSEEEMLRRHTLRSYYSCFRQKGTTDAELRAITQKLIRQGFFLRFCPMCVSEDRERYGEAYWHCSAQYAFCDVCPFHGCKLVGSTVSKNIRGCRPVRTLEEYVAGECFPVEPANDFEQKWSRYIYEATQYSASLSGSEKYFSSASLLRQSFPDSSTPLAQLCGAYENEIAPMTPCFSAALSVISKALSNPGLNVDFLCAIACFFEIATSDLFLADDIQEMEHQSFNFEGPVPSVRNLLLRESAKNGKTVAELAVQHGISNQQVNKILGRKIKRLI